MEVDAHHVRFDLLRFTFYHEDKLSFYVLAMRFTQLLSVLISTAAVSAVINETPQIRTMLIFVITILQTIALVYGFSTSAVLHEAKKSRYAKLFAQLEIDASKEKTITGKEETIKRVKSDMMKENAEEPLMFWCVEALAFNRAYYALTPPEKVKKEELYSVWWWEKLIRHIFIFSPEYFRKRLPPPPRSPQQPPHSPQQ